MENDSTEERFLRLETKVAYQDKLISELNEVILVQGRELSSLRVRMDAVARVVRDGPSEDPSNDPPPHY